MPHLALDPSPWRQHPRPSTENPVSIWFASSHRVNRFFGEVPNQHAMKVQFIVLSRKDRGVSQDKGFSFLLTLSVSDKGWRCLEFYWWYWWQNEQFGPCYLLCNFSGCRSCVWVHRGDNLHPKLPHHLQMTTARNNFQSWGWAAR